MAIHIQHVESSAVRKKIKKSFLSRSVVSLHDPSRLHHDALVGRGEGALAVHHCVLPARISERGFRGAGECGGGCVCGGYGSEGEGVVGCGWAVDGEALWGNSVEEGAEVEGGGDNEGGGGVGLGPDEVGGGGV